MRKKLIIFLFFTIAVALLTPSFVFAAEPNYCCVIKNYQKTKVVSCQVKYGPTAECRDSINNLSGEIIAQSCGTINECVQLQNATQFCCVGQINQTIADCKPAYSANATCDYTGMNYALKNQSCGSISDCVKLQGSAAPAAPSKSPAPTAPKETPFVPIEPKLQINIPTVQFSKITREGQYINIPYLADYIAGVYKYAVSIVSIIAIIMIMVGGLRWLTAGGNASAVSSAKETISGAVIGLILLLGSYTVLYTINPDLVNFKALKIEYIKPDPIVIDLTDEDLKEYAGITVGSGSNNIPLFVQFPSPKSPWANNLCGPNPSGSSGKTIAKAGCGLTSMAMVLKYYFPSQNIDPGAVALLAPSSCSIGDLSASTLSKWGPVAVTQMNVNSLGRIQTLVSQGKPIVFNCKPCVGLKSGTISPRKYGGHLMVLTGYSNGTFSVNDPGGYYTSMTTEMLTNPCKFVSSSDDPKKAKDAISKCAAKAAAQAKGGDVNTNPYFWYLRPVGK